MLLVGLSCILLIGFTTLIHYEVLRGLTAKLPTLGIPARQKLLVVIFMAFVAHTIEITLYGLVLYLSVSHSSVGYLSGPGGASFANCMYFSAETYASLGFGDLVPVGPIRLLAGVEALNGLLMIGWSASYTYIAMERFWTGGPDRWNT